MELAVAVLIQVAYWPLAALLAWRAARGLVPVLAGGAATLLLAASAVAACDPASAEVWSRVANSILSASVAVLLATYPDGRLVPRWIVVPAALEVVIQAGNLASGLRWENVQPWWPAHFLLTWTPLVFGGQLYRYMRRSSVAERERTRWPVLGMLITVFGFVLWSIAAGAAGVSYEATWFANLLNAVLPPAFAIGLLAPRLFPVDSALRVVVGGGLWAIAVGLVAWGIAALTGASPSEAAAWWSAIGTAALAVPLALAARRVADLVVLGRRPDPLRALVALGDRLAVAVDPQEVPAQIVTSITEGLGLRGATLSGPAGLAAASGVVDDGEGVATFPIAYAGESLGVLAVAPRAGEPALSDRDRDVLAQVCAQAAPALHSARVVAELIDARSRVVFAREEERKRLRRDLHDDLAPTFAGLGLAAAAVESFSRAGDERAVDAASRLVSGLHAATRQLRDVAYDLRPPVLDDRGLVAAIQERVVGVPGAVPGVRVEAPADRLVLPAAVESAALRIVQEAVANVRRHAAASECVVTIAATHGELRLAVVDDGIGLPARTHGGLGLRSMRERAAEVGGALTVGRRRSGGTTVKAVLPVPAPPAIAGPTVSVDAAEGARS